MFASLLFLGIVDIEVDCRKVVVCSYERERGSGRDRARESQSG